MVNMQVPEDMVDILQVYLQNMNMSSSRTIETNIENMIDEGEGDFQAELGSETGDKEIFEVVKVVNHKVVNGKWYFKVVWGDNKLSDWVIDEDCSCEDLISEYLKGKGVKTAYLFCRVSTKDQAKSTNLSLEAQESELRTLIQTKFERYTRVRVYAISESAYKNIPETLVRIGAATLEGDGIFVWRVDRLSRNIVKYMEWCENLNSRGVTLYSHQEEISYSSNKLDFIQAILNAQKEASILGSRVKLAIRRKRERGDTHVGSVPFGKKYKRVLNEDGSTKKMIVVDNAEEILIIDEIRRLKRTKKSEEIAQELNSKNYLKRGRKWNKTMVMRMIKLINKR
jgi:DNA invertase Pin-like site-specific DNA recombinase